MVLNNSLLLNETNFTMNGSVNLTVNVIAENLTGHLISETSTFSQVLPIITLILLLAVILPFVPNTIEMIFQIPEPVLTDTIFAEMPVDIYRFINRNLPTGYAVYWLQIASSVIALLFQYLGIEKLEIRKEA